MQLMAPVMLPEPRATARAFDSAGFAGLRVNLEILICSGERGMAASSLIWFPEPQSEDRRRWTAA